MLVNVSNIDEKYFSNSIHWERKMQIDDNYIFIAWYLYITPTRRPEVMAHETGSAIVV